MTGRRVPWAALALATTLVASEISPGAFPDRQVATNALVLLGAVLPVTAIVLRSSAFLRTFRGPAPALLGAWTVWSVVASTWSVDPESARTTAAWTVALVLTGAWYVTEHGWTSFRRVLAWSLSGFVVGCFVHHVVAVGGTRVVGFALAPTNLGFLSGVLVIAAWSLPRRRVDDRVLRVGGVVVGIAGVIGSSTRTVAIGLVVIGAFVAVKRLGATGATMAGALLGVGALAFAVAVWGGLLVIDAAPAERLAAGDPNGFSIAHANANLDEYSTATGRTAIWRAGIDAVLERPVVGWGTGSARQVYHDVAAQGRLYWYAYGTHNSPLGLALTGGGIGLALVVLASGVHLLEARRAPDLARRALLLLVLVDGITETLFDNGGVALLLVSAAFAATANDVASAARTRVVARTRAVTPAPARLR